MPIYIAVPLAPNSALLDAAVTKHFLDPTDKYKLQNDRGWLLRFDGTTVELSNKLEITGQAKGDTSPVGSAIVVPVTSYFGRGPTDMWEWIKTRLEK